MKNRIYYFSGTGNSLQVARDIASKLEDCEIISISKSLNSELTSNYERIGFIFPVYAWGPPSIVTRFVKRLNNVNKNIYIFCAATYKNEPGAVLRYFSKVLNKEGLKLNAGFEVCMPGNHIAHYEADSQKIQKEKFEKWKSQLSEITTVLLNKNEIKSKKTSLFSRFFQTGLLYKIAVKQFCKSDKKFFSSDKCNECGICEEVCPTDNIVIKNNNPTWEHNCEQCLACLHWCPQQAIEFGKKTVGRERYQNPFVRLNDMLKKGD
ncbi:hypothetical protein U472_09700 [Orenia metallireducens]|uniref:4Fe-4S ferredoxin n=1 Tax=Orenia metallireducens TaxID=1413210 RepID=A0A1C0A7N4_9FIRM|nr:EFR1 family ferrodoxin [Orenia metallireducens]OCL26275.1 hypothetical protein U472_09700 [Orenia metallireducens]